MPPRTGRVGVVAVVVLAALDLVLVGALLTHDKGKSAVADAATRLPQAAATPSGRTTPAAEPAASGRPEAAARPVQPTPAAAEGAALSANEPQLLATADGTHLWRATGGCDGDAQAHASADGGATWSPLTLPAPHVLRLTMTSASNGWIIGADARCTPAYYGTYDGGATWSAAGSAETSWYITGGALHAPYGERRTPCTPAAIAPSGSSRALLVCADGSLQRTRDGGGTWTPQDTGGGRVVAAASSSNVSLAVVADAPGCTGLRVIRSTNGFFTPAGCLDAASTPAAVAIGYGTAVALAADQTWTSPDGGRTWGRH